MSPERTQSDAEVDCRSDLYGLGAPSARLTGRPPIEGEVLPVLVKNVRERDPEYFKKYQLAIDHLFADLVMRLLKKRRKNRTKHPAHLIKDLDRIGTYNSLSAD